MIDFDAFQNGSIKEKKSMSSKLFSSIFIFCNLHENQSIHKMVQWNHIINKYVAFHFLLLRFCKIVRKIFISDIVHYKSFKNNFNKLFVHTWIFKQRGNYIFVIRCVLVIVSGFSSKDTNSKGTN